MLRAIIFDCDGVIADTEPLHFHAFQRVLGEEGISLTEEDYYRHYLSFDDRGCFAKAYSGRAQPTPEKISELIARKASYLEPVMRARLKLFPGAADLIRNARKRYPLAIASGARRSEIEFILECGGLKDCFAGIISAEDVSRGKPDPESFLKAREIICSFAGQQIAHRECLVVEDSLRGVEAALLAGMRALAVTNSYSKSELSQADLVVETLENLSLDDLELRLN